MATVMMRVISSDNDNGDRNGDESAVERDSGSDGESDESGVDDSDEDSYGGSGDATDEERDDCDYGDRDADSYDNTHANCQGDSDDGSNREIDADCAADIYEFFGRNATDDLVMADEG